MKVSALEDRMMAPASQSTVDGERRRVELPGSRTLSIRPMRGGDTAGLVALYAALSEDDLYRRFFIAHAPPERFIDKMARVEERGGFGLVAVLEKRDGVSRIVGEASYETIPDGNGELGITVAEDARGWLGPFLLDALVEEAAARGVPNLEADVLVTNRQMLTLLRSRGLAVVDHDDQPAVVRVAIGTTARVPSWSGPHDRPRVLLEVPGGRWHGEEAVRGAGFQVLACPGPIRGWTSCPALRGEPCPLAVGADVIVDALPDELGRSLLEAHRKVHPTVPVCVELPPDASDDGYGGSAIPRGADNTAVVGFLQRLAR